MTAWREVKKGVKKISEAKKKVMHLKGESKKGHAIERGVSIVEMHSTSTKTTHLEPKKATLNMKSINKCIFKNFAGTLQANCMFYHMDFKF